MLTSLEATVGNAATLLEARLFGKATGFKGTLKTRYCGIVCIGGGTTEAERNIEGPTRLQRMPPASLTHVPARHLPPGPTPPSPAPTCVFMDRVTHWLVYPEPDATDPGGLRRQKGRNMEADEVLHQTTQLCLQPRNSWEQESTCNAPLDVLKVGGVVGRAIAVDNDEFVVAVGGLDPRSPGKQRAKRRRRAPRVARLAAGAARQSRNLPGDGWVAHVRACAARGRRGQAVGGAAGRVGDACAEGGAAGEGVLAAQQGRDARGGQGRRQRHRGAAGRRQTAGRRREGVAVAALARDESVCAGVGGSGSGGGGEQRGKGVWSACVCMMQQRC